jgi:hypothetical protein
MKTVILPATHVFVSLLLPLTAQNLSENTVSSGAVSAVVEVSPALRELPQPERVKSVPSDGDSAFPKQDLVTLESMPARKVAVESVMDLAVLTQPSPFKRIASGTAENPAEALTDGVGRDLAVISATYRESGTPGSDCQAVSLSVGQGIKLDDGRLLEIVDAEIRANPGCACEIVKSAITAAEADVETVIAIVETSILAAPETMRIVSQCAIAVVPEALAGVQELLARHDPNAGEGDGGAKSAKSAKSPKSSKEVLAVNEVAAMPNPLDFPGEGPVGPTRGGPGGMPLFLPNPPIIVTRPVTQVDP